MTPRKVTAREVLEEGARRGITFTPEQAEAVSIATTSLLESAARLRDVVSRNDEPAFGFRVALQDAARP